MSFKTEIVLKGHMTQNWLLYPAKNQKLLKTGCNNVVGNNVFPTPLLHPVFNNLLQLVIFCRVEISRTTRSVFHYNRLASCAIKTA